MKVSNYTQEAFKGKSVLEIADMNFNLYMEILKPILEKRPDVSGLMDHLKNKTDFFSSPASTKNHNNFKGGLANHSINVMNLAFDFAESLKPKLLVNNFDETNIIISALFHDVCKYGNYKDANLFTKDSNGRWVNYTGIGYEDEDTLPLGHGEKSLYIAKTFIRLTKQEALAIRWHMGIYDIKPGSQQEQSFYKACENFPLTKIIHLADNASVLIEPTINYVPK